ncbi:MAG: tetratricopeptide repeat protein [Rhodocyclaceae bacterium]|nr:tetratricopeptide repeat protein [Rhodocyclaceae bacterium]
MKRRLLPIVLAAVALGVHAAAQDGDTAPGEAAPPASLPAVALTPQMMYQFLLAEIAGARGQVGLSSEAYIDLARRTRDPRVARRAAEIALFARHYDTALEAARLWAEIEPGADKPRQMMSGLLSVTSRSEELAAHLSRELDAAGEQRGGLLMQLHRLLARHPDKLDAQRIVDKVTTPYLELPEAHFARAQAAQAARDTGVALSELDRALSLRSDWEPAALARAQLTGNAPEQIKFLAAFVEANPKARDARLAYARALVGEKRYGEARGQFQMLLDNPDTANNGDVIFAVGVLSLQLHDFDEAEARFKRLVGMDHAEVDTARLYLGQIGEDRKRWDEALAWYGAVTPGNQYLPARMRAAHVLARQGKLAEARQLLQQSSAGNPAERGQLLIAEAQILREAGKGEDAYAVVAAGLAAHPDQTDLLYESAMLAERIDRLDVMERNLRRLIEIKPDHAHAYNALGFSLADRNLRLDEALQLIDKALQLAPEDPFILDSKGWVMFRLGDAQGALEALQKAFALRADPEIAAHLGEVLWTLGRQDEARHTWEAAAKVSPDNAPLLGTIKKYQP